VGNACTITVRMNCALLLVGRKINQFYPKILPFLTMRKSDFFSHIMQVPAHHGASFWSDVVL